MTETAEKTPALADRIAAAARAEEAPRERAQDLQAALDAAIASGEYGTAERLKAELDEARTDLAFAEATTAALRQWTAALEGQRAADARRIAEARRRDEAQAQIGEAIAAERKALAELDERIDGFWKAVGLCQAAFNAALQCEQAAGAARQRMHEIRVTIGDLEPGGRGPSAPNKASVLMDEYPMLRMIARWRR